MNFPHVVLARLYEHVEPIDRGNRYEDPLQAQLDPRHAGRVTGGGSQLNADGAIDYADIEIELADLDDAVRLTERLLQPSSYTVRRQSALVVRGRAAVDGVFSMHCGRLSRTIGYSLLVMLMVTGLATQGRAQRHDDHGGPASALKLTSRQNDFVRAVQEATAPFKNVTNPSEVGDAYAHLFGCVSGGDFGAMGLHFVKGDILHDGEVTAGEPEILLFEPVRDGGIRLTGADFIVFKEEWEAKHPGKVPELNGQLFHLFDSPTASGWIRSIHCTCGRGRTIQTARSRIGTRTFRATRSTRRASL